MPLKDLIHKSKEFKQDLACDQAFEMLKTKLPCTPILQVYDLEGNYQLWVDVSDFAVGATLVQWDSVSNTYFLIEYMPHQLSPEEYNYSAIEREFVAIVFGLNCQRHYLVGKPCHVRTDHVILKWLMSLPQLSKRKVCWIDFLSQFDLHIEHMPGKQNTVADSLLRRADLAPAVEISSNLLARI